MLWIGVSAIAVASIVLRLAVLRGKRRTDVAHLGAVSDRWIASHRVDVP